MAVADRQMLGELVDFADIAVRAAGQLQLFSLGKPVRDKKVLERAMEFLAAAEAGGAFMSSGDSANLHATLRPLNWAADVQTSTDALVPGAGSVEVDYQVLTEYLREMQSVVGQVLEGTRPDVAASSQCVGFFDSLAETLGRRADQYMRAASLPCSTLASL